MVDVESKIITLRNRDTTGQQRVDIGEIKDGPRL